LRTQKKREEGVLWQEERVLSWGKPIKASENGPEGKLKHKKTDRHRGGK